MSVVRIYDVEITATRIIRVKVSDDELLGDPDEAEDEIEELAEIKAKEAFWHEDNEEDVELVSDEAFDCENITRVFD